MSGYNPFDPSSLWYLAWRQHIINMKRNPAQFLGYARAAVIAQAQYVMYEAVETVKEKSQ